MKSFKALMVFALVFGLAVPAFAETQNVKVSGSLDMYGFNRDNYDLTDNNSAGVLPAGGGALAGSPDNNANQTSESDSYFRTNAQVEVSADLTDNVSTVINLVNQRDWNANDFSAGATTTATTGATTGSEFDVVVDLAYVQMKEIFYAPLTLTLGRQDIWLGRGFLIGNNNTAWDPQGILQADEYSVTTAFDAIRGTLDFNPWTIDLIYSKIQEGSHNPEDDRDLYIANVNYKFAEYNAVAEGYYILEVDENTTAGIGGPNENETNVLGGRVQFDPIAQLTLGAEVAYQFGDYSAAIASPERDLAAWGYNLFATYRVDYTWKPELTLEYVHFSGDDNSGVATTEEYNGWNSLYRGKFWTAYADFREFLYQTSDTADQSATTNQQLIQLKAGLKPLEDLLLEGALSFVWTDEPITGRNDFIGWEADFIATYDYTEDVSFGLLAGWFVPGEFYNDPNDNTATDLVSSVKVAF